MRSLILSLLFAAAAFAQHNQIQVLLADTDAPVTPVDMPGGGTYSSTQSVTITDATATFILYTLDGSTPACPGTGTLYTGAFNISSTSTLKAIGCNGITGGAVLTSVYTISSGVTFGKTTIGGSNNGGAANPICSQYSPGSSGNVGHIEWYGSLASSALSVAGIYSDNSGTPNNLVVGSSQITVGTSPGWNVYTIASTPVVSGTPYWLCVVNAANYSMQFDAGSPNQFSYSFALQQATLLTPFSSFGAPLSQAWAMSIYAAP